MLVNAFTDYESQNYVPPSGIIWDIQDKLITLKRVISNLWALVRAMEHVSIHVTEDGTVALTHSTGTRVTMRADGNFNVRAERNHILETKGLVNFNPEFPEDDHFTSYEDLARAYPERFEPTSRVVRVPAVCDGHADGHR